MFMWRIDQFYDEMREPCWRSEATTAVLSLHFVITSNDTWIIIPRDRGAIKLLFHQDFTAHVKYYG